jgi:hypothetical protein
MKIGFIDYYLDNWHFANYPKLIHDATGGKMEVACACARIDRSGGKPNAQLSKELGIPLYETAEQVIEECDRLIVCAPATPEVHKDLCELPLASGKPTGLRFRCPAMVPLFWIYTTGTERKPYTFRRQPNISPVSSGLWSHSLKPAKLRWTAGKPCG